MPKRGQPSFQRGGAVGCGLGLVKLHIDALTVSCVWRQSCGAFLREWRLDFAALILKIVFCTKLVCLLAIIVKQPRIS